MKCFASRTLMDPHYSAHPGGLEGPGHPAVPTGTPTSTLQLLTTKYIKHSKSVSILWGIFTVCSATAQFLMYSALLKPLVVQS